MWRCKWDHGHPLRVDIFTRITGSCQRIRQRFSYRPDGSCIFVVACATSSIEKCGFRNNDRFLRPGWSRTSKDCHVSASYLLSPLNPDNKPSISWIIRLGGDHTIVLPILRALNKVYGPVSVIHFDAHLDTWAAYPGQTSEQSRVTHGTFFYLAQEEGLMTNTSIHAGIRCKLAVRNP